MKNYVIFLVIAMLCILLCVGAVSLNGTEIAKAEALSVDALWDVPVDILDSVMFVYERGIMPAQGRFTPQGEVTVNEALCYLGRIHLKLGGHTGKLNVSFTGYVYRDYAIANDIIEEYTYRQVNGPVLRSDFCTMLARTVTVTESEYINPTVVGEGITDEISVLAAAGIVTPEVWEEPTTKLTRGEAAVLMTRALNPDMRVEW